LPRRVLGRLMSLEPIANFRAVDRNLRWAAKSQTDTIAVNFQDGNFDPVTDDDRLIGFAGEHEHVSLLDARFPLR
jgi:hypothetical protein